MWRETTQHERNSVIFREELDAFLPKRILDFHVHVFNAGVIPEDRPYSCGGHPVLKYDFDDLTRDLAQVYPGRETYAVCFGFPDPNYDFPRNNEYVAATPAPERFFPLRLLDPLRDTPEGLRRDLEAGRFLGVKPYPDYLRKADVNESTIHEMLPAWAMEIVDALGLLVMLHIPRKGRLADPLNQAQIAELCERYPRARIVLAHVGRAYFLKNAVGNLDLFSSFPNLYCDLAMVGNADVLEYVLGAVPPDRVLYGTDIPIALAPGKLVEINNQYTYVTPEPWTLSISDEHHKLTFTSFLYEELRSIKKAVVRLALPRAQVEGLFFDNGMGLIKAVLDGLRRPSR